MELYDGAFSWDMWPNGPQPLTTAADDSWLASLKPAGKSYMMGMYLLKRQGSVPANEYRRFAMVLHRPPSLRQSLGLAWRSSVAPSLAAGPRHPPAVRRNRELERLRRVSLRRSDL